MANDKTISRQTALEALAELAYADCVIFQRTQARNPLRTEIIERLQDELSVVIRTTP